MKRKMKYNSLQNKKHITVWTMVVVIVGIWFNNTNLFSSQQQTYKLLAHRGLAQTFDISQVEWDTNTAQIIDPPEHNYLENTLESMAISFEYGAQMVELDVQLTKDKRLAVFHDNDLSMRTDGVGTIGTHTMAELKTLDIGYGYTADEGQTYPFRGKGYGLMPEFQEVIDAFAGQELLIHMNHGDRETAEVLWSYLAQLSQEQLANIAIYGNDIGLAYIRQQQPDIPVLSAGMLKQALLKYELLGWSGYIPEEIKNMELHIPITYAKFLWGWPNKFVERMESVNTTVVIVDGNGKWSEGFDTVESLEKIPEGYAGYVWTNRIDIITKHDPLTI